MATFRRAWTTELNRRIRRIEGLLGIGEPEEEQFWAFLAHWAASWPGAIGDRKRADKFNDILEDIARGGGPQSNAETPGELVRWFYDLIWPFVAERNQMEFRQKTQNLWRQALTGEFDTEVLKEWRLKHPRR